MFAYLSSLFQLVSGGMLISICRQARQTVASHHSVRRNLARILNIFDEIDEAKSRGVI
jgi:hypothetical protein